MPKITGWKWGSQGTAGARSSSTEGDNVKRRARNATGGHQWTKTAERSDAAISGPSALDDEGDMEVILHAIRGLGGRVLKTNVDVERAKLIQATLAGISESSGHRAKAS